ncbi:MAG: type II toxin-antitoxin system YafQ family toxin [Oscillospiraceae bacterium]|jgi:mRNA interferase YafQ|nr:type II toxin-antitoxin system YafQ family toxin [Oscillospiraceae bacterium]
MLNPELSNQFKRDYGLLVRRGYDIAKLDAVIVCLLNQTPLEPRHRDHLLKGNWRGYRSCHIADDWVLVYLIDGDRLKLLLSRTGTHVDVYGV